MIKLDYSLKTTQERLALVNQIVETTPPSQLRPQYLTYMSDYILFINDKEQTIKERQSENPIITKNREKTINKRQISFEEIVSSLENGEDGLYAMITNDKNQILDPKDPINDKDIEKNPIIQDFLNEIERLQKKFQKAVGQEKYIIKKQIIETWQQIYIIKASLKGHVARGRTPSQVKNMAHMPLHEHITIGEDLMPHSDCIISLFNPDHISFLLCYYTQLKEESYDDLDSDMHWLLIDLENLAEKALKNESILWDLLVYKTDGLTNEEIVRALERDYGIIHTEQYYSTLWRKRIPKLIAEEATKQYIEWHYFNHVKSEYIKCGRCGKYKLAHPIFFSTNSNNKGYYSICKECRRKGGEK